MGTSDEQIEPSTAGLPKLHTVTPGEVFTSSDGRQWQAGAERWEFRGVGTNSVFAVNRRRARVMYGVTLGYVVVLIFVTPLIGDYWGRVALSASFLLPLTLGLWFSHQASKRSPSE